MCDRDVSKDVTCSPDDYTVSLMAQVGQLQAEVERLRGENIELHEEVAEWNGRAFGFKCACESLIEALYKIAND